MKTVWLILLLGLSNTVVLAQDSTQQCQTKKTFVIRKKVLTTAPALQKEALAAKAKIKKEEKPTLSQKPSKLATIAGGEFGLMDIRPYYEDMSFYDWNYVILQYDVNQYGWAVDIVVEGSSSSKFADYVVGKLKKTKWNPALNQKGKPIQYPLFKQVIIVKDKLYEEFFTEDY